MDMSEDYKEDWSQFLKGPYEETQSSSLILFDGEIDWKVNLQNQNQIKQKMPPKPNGGNVSLSKCQHRNEIELTVKNQACLQQEILL